MYWKKFSSIDGLNLVAKVMRECTHFAILVTLWPPVAGLYLFISGQFLHILNAKASNDCLVMPLL